MAYLSGFLHRNGSHYKSIKELGGLSGNVFRLSELASRTVECYPDFLSVGELRIWKYGENITFMVERLLSVPCCFTGGWTIAV